MNRTRRILLIFEWLVHPWGRAIIAMAADGVNFGFKHSCQQWAFMQQQILYDLGQRFNNVP